MKRLLLLAFSMLTASILIFSNSVFANSNLSSNISAAVDLQSFEIDSFEQIVNAKNQQDHLVILWSFDCPPCIKELQKISDLHQQYPEYQLTLINTDSIDEQERVKKLIQQYNLAGLDNWGFANTDEEKLRYDIDPRWFGDLPRSYFFPLEGKVKRLRGALTSAELLALFQPS